MVEISATVFIDFLILLGEEEDRWRVGSVFATGASVNLWKMRFAEFSFTNIYWNVINIIHAFVMLEKIVIIDKKIVEEIVIVKKLLLSDDPVLL